MKVLVITGSPHKNGTTAALAEQFIAGAKAAGHEVTRFDAAFKQVHPCIACEKCHTADAGCVFKDDMEELNPLLFAADAVAFVSPAYYYTVSAQIKAAIDRFYANDAALYKGKKAVLITMSPTPMWRNVNTATPGIPWRAAGKPRASRSSSTRRNLRRGQKPAGGRAPG